MVQDRAIVTMEV